MPSSCCESDRIKITQHTKMARFGSHRSHFLTARHYIQKVPNFLRLCYSSHHQSASIRCLFNLPHQLSTVVIKAKIDFSISLPSQKNPQQQTSTTCLSQPKATGPSSPASLPSLSHTPPSSPARKEMLWMPHEHDGNSKSYGATKPCPRTGLAYLNRPINNQIRSAESLPIA